MIKDAKTKEGKKEALFKYVEGCRSSLPVETTCQWKGGKDERFCRATHQKTCEGCSFYKIGIWDFFSRVYDIVKARDTEIAALRQENEVLKKGLHV